MTKHDYKLRTIRYIKNQLNEIAQNDLECRKNRQIKYMYHDILDLEGVYFLCTIQFCHDLQRWEMIVYKKHTPSIDIFVPTK